jgi:integrative and conjugative element protein (TIGR02256 family)
VRHACLFLPHAVLEQMECEAGHRYPDESGGVLLGYRDTNNGRLIQVLEQVGPGPKAVHRAHRFEPDTAWQEMRIASAYKKSGRTAAYLGDWHSHPRGSSTPSALDRATARAIARCPEARAPHPLIVILFGEPRNWRPTAYRRGRWRLQEIEVSLAQNSGSGQ